MRPARRLDQRNTKTMRRGTWAMLVLVVAVFGQGSSGCDHHDHDHDGGHGYDSDYHAPAAPRAVYSVTGDHAVEIGWIGNTEYDLDGYRVYRNNEPSGYFERIATVSESRTHYTDRDVRNGRTYYYAVAAFDKSGNESELSHGDVFDTPRPAGRDLYLTNATREPRRSGYDFSRFEVLDYRDLEADIFFWSTPEDGDWMVATERDSNTFTDIQDAGFVHLDDVDWAPEDGWAPTGDVPLIVGHSYIVWTWDNYFAKFRVLDIDDREVRIDWAYQVDRGNPELRVPGEGQLTSQRSGSGDRTHRVSTGRR